MTDEEIEKYGKIECKKLLSSEKGYNGISFQEFWEEGAKWGIAEGRKEVDLELIHIINDIVKYRDDEETRNDEYETAVWKLARYWEKLGKIELAEWTLAQIGVNAWTIQ